MALPPPDPRDDVVDRLRAAGCVFAEEEAGLLREAAPTPAALAALVDERTAGVPLEQLLGWVDFHGLRLHVGRGVFVPRRRTRLLVDAAIAALDESTPAGPPPTVVEMCCGVAAVATAIASRRRDVVVHAAEIDPHAVVSARRNLEPHGGLVHEGDLYDALPADLRGRVDVLVANAPYVPTDDIALMPPEARLHEQRIALDGGADGMDVQRRLVMGAGEWLRPGGALLVESSRRQAPGLAAGMRAHGLVARVVRDEDVDGTAVVGTARA